MFKIIALWHGFLRVDLRVFYVFFNQNNALLLLLQQRFCDHLSKITSSNSNEILRKLSWANQQIDHNFKVSDSIGTLIFQSL